MRKIFHFDSPADPYVADAAVLCCFDDRISTVVRKFLRKQNIVRCDMSSASLIGVSRDAERVVKALASRLASYENEAKRFIRAVQAA